MMMMLLLLFPHCNPSTPQPAQTWMKTLAPLFHTITLPHPALHLQHIWVTVTSSISMVVSQFKKNGRYGKPIFAWFGVKTFLKCIKKKEESIEHLWHEKTGSMIFWIASRHTDLLNPWKTTVHQIPSHAISIPVHRLSARRLNWQQNFRPATGSVKCVV